MGWVPRNKPDIEQEYRNRMMWRNIMVTPIVLLVRLPIMGLALIVNGIGRFLEQIGSHIPGWQR